MNNYYLSNETKWYYFQNFERFHEYYNMKKQKAMYYMPVVEQVAAQYSKEWDDLWRNYISRRKARMNDMPTWKGICRHIEIECKKSIWDACKLALGIK